VHVLRGARLFLNHLQEAGIIASVPIQSAVPAPALFVAFCQWMRDQRGTCESTLSNYGVHIIELLRRLGGDPHTFDARSLREFVIEGSHVCGWAAAKKRLSGRTDAYPASGPAPAQTVTPRPRPRHDAAAEAAVIEPAARGYLGRHPQVPQGTPDHPRVLDERGQHQAIPTVGARQDIEAECSLHQLGPQVVTAGIGSHRR